MDLSASLARLEAVRSELDLLARSRLHDEPTAEEREAYHRLCIEEINRLKAVDA